jgi:hypothetical protein
VLNWAAFERAAPELAERGRARIGFGVAWLATTSADGEPNVHPVTPLIAEGRLLVFVALGTPKERNLRRDGRYAMHGVLGQDDEEFLIRGRATVSDDAASRAIAHRAAEAIGMTTKDDVLMEFFIERAHWARWEGLGTPEIRKVSQRWRESGG